VCCHFRRRLDPEAVFVESTGGEWNSESTSAVGLSHNALGNKAGVTTVRSGNFQHLSHPEIAAVTAPLKFAQML